MAVCEPLVSCVVARSDAQKVICGNTEELNRYVHADKSYFVSKIVNLLLPKSNLNTDAIFCI